MTIRLVTILTNISFTLLFFFGVTTQANATTYEDQFYTAIEQGNEQNVQELFQKISEKRKLEIINSHRGVLVRNTPLFMAVSSGYLRIVELLLENGANVNQSIRFGFTPLQCAATYGETDIVRILLNYGVSIDATDKLYNQTALHKAVTEGHPDIVRLLVREGAAVNRVDYFLQTPLDYCRRHEKDLCEELQTILGVSGT